MPHTQDGLPFAKGSHTSYEAAVDAAPSRDLKKAQYRRLLRARGPLSDWEVHRITGWPLSSVCSIRNGVPDVVKAGYGKSPFGKIVTTWGLSGR